MGLTATTSSVARRRIAALAPATPAVTPPTELLLRRVGVPADPRTRLQLAVSGASGVLALLVVGGPTATALAGAAAGLAFAGWRRGARARRARADERELPHLLERVARHLRAGGSLSQAFVAASPPPPSPAGRGSGGGGLADAWRAVADRSASIGMVPALDEWADQARSASNRSIALAVAALAVAAATGGSPARAVDGVASTLRSRLAVAEEVRALSSQARASAMVIAVSPVGFGVLAAATDDRTAAFLATPAGVALVAIGLALDAAGAWWMARLCRVRA